MGNNSLTGAIPTGFVHLQSLRALGLLENKMSGTVPTFIGELKLLQLFTVAFNSFHGTIPSELGLLSELLFLGLARNRLSVTIPSSLQASTQLQFIDVSLNYLHGQFRVPLDSMEAVLLSHNSFTGNVNDIFPIEVNYSKLIDVDFSYNSLTGTLPYQIFSEKLTTFIGENNCFSGTLSTEICRARSLQILDLAALTATCKQYKYIKGFTVTLFAGDVPECIFELPNVVDIYLFNNGLNSRIPDAEVSLSLRTIDMSNNRLSGPIPLSIQKSNQLTNLDLSNNFLTGTIESMITDNININLAINRISGLIPTQLLYLRNINILSGNIFDCTTIPQYDENLRTYVCGSSYLDYFNILCASIVSVLVIIGVLFIHSVFYPNKSYVSNTAQVVFLTMYRYLIWVPESGTNSRGIEMLASTLHLFRHYCAWIVAFISFIFLPIYIILKSYNSCTTYTHQYGWVVSVAYLQGENSAVVVFVTTLVFILFGVTVHNKIFTIKTTWHVRDEDSLSRLSQLYAKRGAFIIVDIAVVTIVNYIYIFILTSRGLAVQIGGGIILVLFKLFWNANVVYPILDELHVSSQQITSVILINNLVIPIILSMIVEPDCFNGLVKQYTGSTPAQLPLHVAVNGTLLPVVIDQSSTFDTPFIYTENCSSTILYSYTPVFILFFGISGIFVPFLQLVTTWYFNYNMNENKAKWLSHLKEYIYYYDVLTLGTFCRATLPIQDIKEMESLVVSVSGVSHRKPFYDIGRFSVTFIIYVYLLLTFGVCYPPLAMLLLICITLQSLALQVCIHHHFIQVTGKGVLFETWSKVLAEEIQDFYTALSGATNMSFALCSMTISLFLVDMTYKMSYAGNNSYLYVILPILLFTFTSLVLLFSKYHHYTPASRILAAFNNVIVDFSRPSTVNFSKESGHNWFGSNYMFPVTRLTQLSEWEPTIDNNAATAVNNTKSVRESNKSSLTTSNEKVCIGKK